MAELTAIPEFDVHENISVRATARSISDKLRCACGDTLKPLPPRSNKNIDSMSVE